MNDGGYVFQSCMCLYIAAVCVGGVLHPTRLCKTCINTTPSAAMYNRRKKAKLVISRRNWVVLGRGTEDFACFTLVVHVFVYSWQVNACPDSKNWPKQEMVTRPKGNIKCLWSSFTSLRAEEKQSIEITTKGVSTKHFKMTPSTGWEIACILALTDIWTSMAGKKPKLHYKLLDGSLVKLMDCRLCDWRGFKTLTDLWLASRVASIRRSKVSQF